MSWGRSTKIRKYREGKAFADAIDMILALRRGRYVFVRGKPYHPTVLRNWSLASLEGACHFGMAAVAELTPEWIAAEELKTEVAREEAHVIDAEFEDAGE